MALANTLQINRYHTKPTKQILIIFIDIKNQQIRETHGEPSDSGNVQ